MKLSMRSRNIEMRWSTNPDDMDYGPHRAPDQLPGRPNYRGSPRGALKAAREAKRRVGQGIYIRIEYRVDGQKIDAVELQEFVDGIEYDKMCTRATR
jgi:hypothetical protein